MIDSAREVRGSVRVGGKNLKNVWWNDTVNDAVERKETAGKEVFSARDEVAMDGVLQIRKEKD